MSEKDKKLLTIIIPCFNAEKYIERCVSSLENLRDEISILFVNDGSVDETKKMLDEWIKKHHNAKVVEKENGGYASAINYGLDNCNSEYVMFLGVDDEIVAQGLNEICRFLYGNKPDILAFSTVKYYDDEIKGRQFSEKDPMTVYKEEKYYKTDITSLYRVLGDKIWILFTRDTSRCYKYSTIGDLRYFGKTGVSADGCFASLVACRAQSFEFENVDCYLWHVHEDSVSGRSKTPPKLIEEAAVWSEYFSMLCSDVDLHHIPNPIVDHFFNYQRIIKKIRKLGLVDVAKKHQIKSKEYIVWLKKHTDVFSKEHFKLLFPKMYLFYIGR